MLSGEVNAELMGPHSVALPKRTWNARSGPSRPPRTSSPLPEEASSCESASPECMLTSNAITRRAAGQRVVSSSTTSSSTPSRAPKRKKTKPSDSPVAALAPHVAEPVSAPGDAEKFKSKSRARAEKPDLPLDEATEGGVATVSGTPYYGNEGEESRSNGPNREQDADYEDDDNNADDSESSEDADDSDDWSESNKSDGRSKDQPASTGIYSPSPSAIARGSLKADISSEVEEDSFWVLHEDHRVLNMLCKSAAPILPTPRNDIRKLQNYDRESEHFCRLRYKFQRNVRLEEEEVQEVTEMVKHMLIWGQRVKGAGQGMADRGGERLRSLDQTNFAMLHKRFSVDSE